MVCSGKLNEGGTTTQALVPFGGRAFLVLKIESCREVILLSIHVTLPDGSVKAFESGVTVEDVAASISPSLKKQAVAGKVDGHVVDLNREIEKDATVKILTLKDEEGLEVYRHSTAHLMAQAIKRLYPDVKLGIGPVIEDGFYYDVHLPESLTPEDLPEIEREMQNIVKEDLPIERQVVSREEAIQLYEEVGDPYKLELIRELPDDAVITIYRQGEFFISAAVPTCRQPAGSRRLNC